MARVLDLIIELALFLVLVLPSATVSVGHRRFWWQLPGFSSAPALWAIGAGFLAFFFWEWAWLQRRGTTPGRQMLGLWLADDDGAVPPSRLNAAIRVGVRALFGVPVLGMVLLIADALTAGWFINADADKRQSMTDRWAKTRIVGSTRPEAGWGFRPIARNALNLVFAGLALFALSFGIWRFTHQPALAEAERVLADIRDDRLAEATSSFASSCPVDRATYANYFSQNRIAGFDLDRVSIEWAVPLFAEADERTEATVTGTATVIGQSTVNQRVTMLLVREDGWKMCRFVDQ